VRKFGWEAFYGDATRLDLLRTAGAGRARVFVLAIDDVEQSVAVARLVREHFPALQIVARARNVGHYYRLRELGVTAIERETLDSALMSARSVMEAMGWERHSARNLAMRFRQHNVAQLDEMAPHLGDEKRLIAMAKQGRQQLEELWARERGEQRQRSARAGWTSVPDADAASRDASDTDRPSVGLEVPLAPEPADQPEADQGHHAQRHPDPGR
jgi:glutathione-regulated potassium-efflux system ancillary protein KefC